MSDKSENTESNLHAEEAVAVADEQPINNTPSDDAIDEPLEDIGAMAKSKQAKITIEELNTLKDELAAVTKKADNQWDVAVRAKAETDNIRKRAERDVENAHKFGIEKLLKELLPVVDGIEQGLDAAAQQEDSANALREGMVLTLQMLQNVLKKFNVEQIKPEGEQFDPSQHEAMSMLENQEVKPGTILHVVQAGYILHGRIIRPARVIVAKGNSEQSIDEKA